MAAPAAPALDCFPLPERVVVPVFSAADIYALAAAHGAVKQLEEIRKKNLVICSVASALLTHARDTDLAGRLKTVCQNEPEPWKLEVELFRFNSTSLNCDVWDTVGDVTAGTFAANSGEDTTVNDLPNSYLLPWNLTGEDLTTPLWKVLNSKTGCLELIAAGLGASWNEHHFKVIVRQDPVRWLDAESKVGVGARRVIVKFFPRGLPPWDAAVLERVKTRWGIKATGNELAAAEGGEAGYYSCGCGCE